MLNSLHLFGGKKEESGSIMTHIHTYIRTHMHTHIHTHPRIRTRIYLHEEEEEKDVFQEEGEVKEVWTMS